MSLNPYFDNIPDGSSKPSYNNIVPPVRMITDVVVEPVALEEVKRHLKVDFTDDDVYLEGVIIEAREQVEEEINQALAPKTIKVGLRNELGNIKLPYWTPEAELVELTDKEGVVIDANSYHFFNGVLETKYSEVVFAEYTTGYESCPVKYRRKILERAAYLYNNRGDSSKNSGGVWLA